MNSRLLAAVVAALWCAVLAAAAGVVYVKHEARSLFVELEKLSAERDRLNIEWGQLQLEQSAWSSHPFVEQVANRKLHMVMPAATDVRIVRP